MPLFYFFALAQLLQGLAYYVPLIYLPSYATSLGLSGTMGALLLVVASFAQVLGQMAFGFVSDMRIPRLWVDGRVPVHILLFLSTSVSGISILALWGLARSLGMLIAFAALYGISAGGFAVLWARMSTTLSSSPSLALTTFSYFALTKGIGNVLTGPIGSALISRSPHADRDVYADGKFEGIVLYSGACMLASAAVMVAWGAGRKMVGVVRRGKGEEGKEGCAA
ncbi:MAG: hypothetical protein L6R35_000332 [Caloplaca aegaea]|nr:MAG: hypothetical protein L6R35_000332 [Caloplaca aegaea]